MLQKFILICASSALALKDISSSFHFLFQSAFSQNELINIQIIGIWQISSIFLTNIFLLLKLKLMLWLYLLLWYSVNHSISIHKLHLLLIFMTQYAFIQHNKLCFILCIPIIIHNSIIPIFVLFVRIKVIIRFISMYFCIDKLFQIIQITKLIL